MDGPTLVIEKLRLIFSTKTFSLFQLASQLIMNINNDIETEVNLELQAILMKHVPPFKFIKIKLKNGMFITKVY